MSDNPEIIRTFVPGEAWLYYKLFTGAKTADLILKDYLWPTILQLKQENVIDKWFFVRYNDPDFHIRLRLHLTPSMQFSKVLSTITTVLKTTFCSECIWRVQLDSYDRELERYGKETIVLAETIFFRDSECAISFLASYRNLESDLEKWLLALYILISYLESFGFSSESNLQFLEELRDSYAKEFNMDRSLKKQLDAKYRNFKQDIEQLVIKTPCFIKELDHAIVPLKSAICAITTHIEISNNKKVVLASLMHMHMNRMFCAKNRLYELVCYDFLFRLYRSRKARGLGRPLLTELL